MYTVVTGMFDIGRGNWKAFQRPVSYYAHFFANVLQLKAPMVVFCEPKFVELVKQVRAQVPHRTVVIVLSVEQLYMNRYRELLFKIQKDPEYGKKHPNPVCPEIAEPLYSLVVASKPDLLRRALEHVETEFCFWLDGGYTHSRIDISKVEWNPTSLYEIKDKVSLIRLRPIEDMISEDPVEFSNQYIDIINGGFFGGHKDAVKTVTDKYYEVVEDLLVKHRVKEDDQYYWTFLAKRHPELVNLIPGDWYDAFKIQ